MTRQKLLLAMLLAWVPMSGHAFVDPPRIVPAHATTRMPVALRVRAGGCHNFWADVNDGEVVVTGPGQLQLIASGTASLEPGNPFCVYSVFDYRFNMGTFAEGKYTVQLFIRDLAYPETPVAFGSASFEVSEPLTIPALDPGWMILAAGTLLVSGVSLGRRNFGS